MSYASTGFLAALVLIIINKDILWKKHTDHEIPAQNAYRRFLLGVLGYYITDMIWGVLDQWHLVFWLYVDTSVYFIMMAMAILFWTQFVVGYLSEEHVIGTILHHTGWVFLVLQAVAVVVNLFYPVLFWFDENVAYQTGIIRYITLFFQILMFLMTSVYALRGMISVSDHVVRRRYETIGLFAMSMVMLIAIQILYPLLPLYSIGCMLGTCLLHTFVIEDERNEYRRDLEASLQRERQQEEEIGAARQQAYTDALTGVKNGRAYEETEQEMDLLIAENKMGDFAVAVFDLNNLKGINDSFGHEVGNQFIIDAAKLIGDQFKHSAVFRIGGDEFAVILRNRDFGSRYTLQASFERQIRENIHAGEVVVAMGMADYERGEDRSVKPVFDRADRIMYRRKEELKNPRKSAYDRNSFE